ncbi:MAG: TlpA family protein disulfide reductase [Acidimicrobiales bacterium]
MSKSRPTHYPKSGPATRPATGTTKGRPTTARRRRITQRQRRQRRRTIYSIVVALVLVATITLAFVGRSSSVGYRTTATNWSLPTLDGGTKVDLASLKGHPTVVNFFASWCQVCASELPVFAHDAVALRGKVNVVEVNALETGNGQSFASRYHLFKDATAVLRDVGGAQGDGLFQSLGGSSSMPMTAFYDANGQLITTHIGGYDATSLAAQLKTLYGVSAPI